MQQRIVHLCLIVGISKAIGKPSNQTETGDDVNYNSGYGCEKSVANSHFFTTTIPTIPKMDHKTLLMGLDVEICQYHTCEHSQPVCKCDTSCLLYNDCCYDNLIRLVGRRSEW